MKVEIDLRKSLEENANAYFEKSKKARLKLKGLEKAVGEMQEKIKKMEVGRELKEENEIKEKTEGKNLIKKRSKEWFEKFHWFYTSEGLLCIAGKDRQSNEQLVKKHLQEKDLYFHAEITGASHCVLKEGQNAGRESLKEAAQFAGVWSKAWQQGLQAIDVYSAKPRQVSKKAPSGESIATGAFMIYGKREWFKKTELEIAVGIDEKERVISGAKKAVENHSKVQAVILKPGSEGKSEIAKKLQKIFEKKLQSAELDEIIAVIPANSRIENI